MNSNFHIMKIKPWISLLIEKFYDLFWDNWNHTINIMIFEIDRNNFSINNDIHGIISSPTRLLFRGGQTGNWGRMSLPASVCVKNVFEGNFLALKITIYEWLGVIKYHWKFILHTHAYDAYGPYHMAVMSHKVCVTCILV